MKTGQKRSTVSILALIGELTHRSGRTAVPRVKSSDAVTDPWNIR